jgi:hypothetical protein
MDTLPLFADADLAQTAPAAAVSAGSNPPEVDVLTFEQFAVINGAGRGQIGDAALHNPAAHMPASTWKRFVALQSARSWGVIVRRAQLQVEYDQRVAAGEFRPPTAKEECIARARGVDDADSVQAARRICARRGWEWREVLGDAGAGQ